jgi:VanZ family protein
VSSSSRAVLRRSPAPLALMALIFYLSAQSDPGPEVPGVMRMVAHAGEFGLLTVLWAWALRPALALGRAAFVAAAIAFAYAISDEYHQSFVPGRHGDPLDVAIDSVGIAVAVVLLRTRALARAMASLRAGAVRSRTASRAGSPPGSPRSGPDTRRRG